MTNLVNSSQSSESGAVSKGERTRAAVIEAAVGRFARDGYQHTSIANVARDVGITPAAVYRYFGDKEDLFIAAVDEEAQAFVDIARAAVLDDPGVSIRAVLLSLVEALDGALRDHPLVARVLSGSEPMMPSRLLAIPQLQRMRDDLTRLFELGQGVGLVRTDLDAASLATGCQTVVLYQLAHLATLLRADEKADLDDDRWQAVATLMEAAIRPG